MLLSGMSPPKLIAPRNTIKSLEGCWVSLFAKKVRVSLQRDCLMHSKQVVVQVLDKTDLLSIDSDFSVQVDLRQRLCRGGVVIVIDPLKIQFLEQSGH